MVFASFCAAISDLVLQALLRVKLFASPHAPAGAARKDGSVLMDEQREAIPTASWTACVWLGQAFAGLR
ncbi:hypothetical protein AOC05_16735 [Arthrobacter alpinus]|uniref:Uncharacterized protein n=1 Tax=Arthrobacter alpinus TaxID=656366 RepID=A0A0M4RR02_9MICC|nr:hypothetical protein AOC05_16735 [Arthrobacter alpinus]